MGPHHQVNNIFSLHLYKSWSSPSFICFYVEKLRAQKHCKEGLGRMKSLKPDSTAYLGEHKLFQKEGGKPLPGLFFG